MTRITLYGKKSSSYEYLKMMLLDKAKTNDIACDLTEINSVEAFIENGLVNIPAVKIEDDLINYERSDINDYLNRVTRLLVKRANNKSQLSLLVPTDFSGVSNNAVNYALQFSQYNNAVINLLHVYRPKTTLVEESGIEQLENTMRKELDKYTDEISVQNVSLPANQTVVESTFKIGFAAEQILNESERLNNCMIVIGSTGSSDSLKKIFGSVSLKVARESNVPALIVPQYSRFSVPARIAYCSSSLEADAYAVQELVEVAKNSDAKLDVLHINQPGSHASYPIDEIKNIFTSFYPKEKINFISIDSENTIDAVNNYCIDNDIKLLSVCRAQKGLFKKIFQESFSKRLAINTQIPLLILNK